MAVYWLSILVAFVCLLTLRGVDGVVDVKVGIMTVPDLRVHYQVKKVVELADEQMIKNPKGATKLNFDFINDLATILEDEYEVVIFPSVEVGFPECLECFSEVSLFPLIPELKTTASTAKSLFNTLEWGNVALVRCDLSWCEMFEEYFRQELSVNELAEDIIQIDTVTTISLQETIATKDIMEMSSRVVVSFGPALYLQHLIKSFVGEFGSENLPQFVFLTEACENILQPSSICNNQCVLYIEEMLKGSLCLSQPWETDEHWMDDVWNPAVSESELSTWEKYGSGLPNWEDMNMDKIVPVVWGSVHLIGRILNSNCEDLESDETQECVKDIVSNPQEFSKLLHSTTYHSLVASNKCSPHFDLPLSVNYLGMIDGNYDPFDDIYDDDNYDDHNFKQDAEMPYSGGVNALGSYRWIGALKLDSCQLDILPSDLEVIVWPDGTRNFPKDRVYSMANKRMWLIDVIAHVIGIIIMISLIFVIMQQKKPIQSKLCLIPLKDCMIIASMAGCTLIMNLIILILHGVFSKVLCFLSSLLPLCEYTMCTLYLLSCVKSAKNVMVNSSLLKKFFLPSIIHIIFSIILSFTMIFLRFFEIGILESNSDPWGTVEYPSSDLHSFTYERSCKNADDSIEWFNLLTLFIIIASAALLVQIDMSKNKEIHKSEKKCNFKVRHDHLFFPVATAVFIYMFKRVMIRVGGLGQLVLN
eukprot:TRINITY_DN3711_c0_g1_i2.p1 TRINITY_DN3711_c0_g1~~TRINITY_DN3711_c0_g1_i2.p1  ORF type:complete len:700 (+),score=100.94 TRINITY_DN3711_c0_g1_i2:126-2225(+)